MFTRCANPRSLPPATLESLASQLGGPPSETVTDPRAALARARELAGLQKEIRLGNLDARRDWGYTGDFVHAMHLMLQQPEPRDYVIGTGETHTVQEFVELAFSIAGLDWKKHVIVDPKLVRPAEVDILIAQPKRAREDGRERPRARPPRSAPGRGLSVRRLAAPREQEERSRDHGEREQRPSPKVQVRDLEAGSARSAGSPRSRRRRR